MIHRSAALNDLRVLPSYRLEILINAYLKSAARVFCHPDLPPGCMMANSTCESAGDDMPQGALNLISDINQKIQQSLIDFISEEKAMGNIKSHSSPLALALYLMSINSGVVLNPLQHSPQPGSNSIAVWATLFLSVTKEFEMSLLGGTKRERTA